NSTGTLGRLFLQPVGATLSPGARATARPGQAPAPPARTAAGPGPGAAAAAPSSAATPAVRRTAAGLPAPRPGTVPTPAPVASTIALEVLQERIVALEHDHALAVGERTPVGLQAAVERVERRIGGRALRVQARGLGVAFTAQALGVALGLGHDHGLVAVGLRTHGTRLLLALGAQRAGHLLALGAHAVVDLLDHVAVGRQVDLLEADVDDPHAQGLGAAVDAFQLLGDDLAAVARHQLGQGAGVDLVAQRVLDDRRQAVGGRALHAAGGAVERTHVVDVADGDEVHRNVLALGGQVTLRREVDQAEAAVEHARGLDQRPLEVQAGADVGAGDAAEVQDDGGVALVDHEDAAEQRQHRGDGERDPGGGLHRAGSGRASRPSARAARGGLTSAGVASTAGATNSGVGAGTAPGAPDAFAPPAGASGTYSSCRPSAPRITRLPASTCCTVSSHRRLRVTSGAALYWSSSSEKRVASPVARSITATL